MANRNVLLDSRFHAFAEKEHPDFFQKCLASQIANPTQHARIPATSVNAPVRHRLVSPTLPPRSCLRSRSPMVRRPQAHSPPAISTSRAPSSRPTSAPRFEVLISYAPRPVSTANSFSPRLPDLTFENETNMEAEPSEPLINPESDFTVVSRAKPKNKKVLLTETVGTTTAKARRAENNTHTPATLST